MRLYKKCACPFLSGIGCLLIATALAGTSLAQSPGYYRIDSAASKVEIRVFRSGFLSALGDNHQIELQRFEGTAKSESAGEWDVRVMGEAASLKVVDPASSPSTRAEVQQTMVGPGQMDVRRFPTIEIVSYTTKPGANANSLILEADLTLHGETRKVDFPLAWNQDGGSIRVKGKASLRLRDFNIEPISRGLGAVKVRNEFEVDYDIVLRRDLSPHK